MFKKDSLGHYHKLFGQLSLKNKSIEKSKWLQKISLDVNNADEITNNGYWHKLYNTDCSLCQLHTFYWSCRAHDVQSKITRLPFLKGRIPSFAKLINWKLAFFFNTYLKSLGRKGEKQLSIIKSKFLNNLCLFTRKLKANIWIIVFVKIERWDETNQICPFSAKKNSTFFFFNIVCQISILFASPSACMCP